VLWAQDTDWDGGASAGRATTRSCGCVREALPRKRHIPLTGLFRRYPSDGEYTLVERRLL